MSCPILKDLDDHDPHSTHMCFIALFISERSSATDLAMDCHKASVSPFSDQMALLLVRATLLRKYNRNKMFRQHLMGHTGLVQSPSMPLAEHCFLGLPLPPTLLNIAWY